VHWSVRTAETGLAALAGVAILGAAFFVDAAGRVLGVIAGLGLLALAGSDLAWRPRLAVHATGLRVRTPGRSTDLPWTNVTRVRVDERQRFGLTSRTLEIDAGDDLIILGRRSLGTDPRDVAAALTDLRYR
jgi:Bacterial PH domain